MDNRGLARQTLIFDGDDTLWENNVYFERAIDDFIAWLNHSALGPEDVRAVIDEVEHANIAVHGYGALALRESLRQSFVRLRERDLSDAELRTVTGFAERILSEPVDLIADVETTLTRLASRHDLALLTKGHAEEQRLKIERSGLDASFAHVFVVPEKDAAVYRAVRQELGSEASRTWMIGNAPRSDINPALAAGLNAVFIPHDQTWRLEHQTVNAVPEGQRLIRLRRFGELTERF